MFVRATLAAFLAATTISPAMAQKPAGTEASEPVKEKKICRRAIATGSVMTKVTCRTKAEWDAITARSQSDLQRTLEQERSRATAQPGL